MKRSKRLLIEEELLKRKYTKQDLIQMKPDLTRLRQYFELLEPNYSDNSQILKFIKLAAYHFYQTEYQQPKDDAALSDELITSDTVELFANIKHLEKQDSVEQKDDPQLLKKVRKQFQVSYPRGLAKIIAARSFILYDYGYNFYSLYIKMNNLEHVLERRDQTVHTYQYFIFSLLVSTYRLAEKYMMRKHKYKKKTTYNTLKTIAKMLKHFRLYLDKDNCKTFLLLIIQKFNFATVEYQDNQIDKFYFWFQHIRTQSQKHFTQVSETNSLQSENCTTQQLVDNGRMMRKWTNSIGQNKSHKIFQTKQFDQQLLKRYLDNKTITQSRLQLSSNFPNLSMNQTTNPRLNDIQISNLLSIKQMSQEEESGLPLMVELDDEALNKLNCLQSRCDIRRALSRFVKSWDKKRVENLILGLNHIILQNQE